MINIDITRTNESKLPQMDFNNILFGRQFSDHMFIADYRDGVWTDARIVPFSNLSMSPAASVLHYGQSIFEGMKAHRGDNGEVFLFRMEDNMRRLNISAKRMCIPELPEEIFRSGLAQLLDVDRDWVPDVDGTALYIRPFMFATDEYIGVKAAETYRFMIFTCPVGAYYSEPVKVKIELEYSRAAAGGTGFAKAAGNYAASIYPAKLAQEQGMHQLIWTDARDHKYIEEAGTMNILFELDGKLITPKSSETILHGITRDSAVQVARSWGVEVEEREISVDEIIEGLQSGRLTDAYGAGTAATIAHIGLIRHKGIDYMLPPVEERGVSNKLKDYLVQFKIGHVEDTFGWRTEV